jgi:GNAT superfamily N-acetyltransferase
MRFLIDPDGIAEFYRTFSQMWSPYLYDVRVRRLEKLLNDMGRPSGVSKLLLRAINWSGLTKKMPYTLAPRYAEIALEQACPGYGEMVRELIAQLVDFRYRGRWIGSRFLQTSALAYKAPLSQHALASLLGTFAQRVIQRIVELQRAQYFVEDTPWNMLWFGELLDLMPTAKLVHIYRDPRDVVASYTQQRWSPTNPILAAQWYKGIMEQWWRVRAHLPPDSFREISLEHFVDNTEQCIHEVCRFWEIPYHPALMRTDLSHSHAGRWKRELNAHDQQAISAILAEPLKLMGYC